MTAEDKPSFKRALLAGGAAGFAVDVSLFPIDTLKTRLQAPGGFRQAGGFSGIYRGLGAAAAGSVPVASRTAASRVVIGATGAAADSAVSGVSTGVDAMPTVLSARCCGATSAFAPESNAKAMRGLEAIIVAVSVLKSRDSLPIEESG